MILDELFDVYHEEGMSEREIWEQIAEDAMTQRRKRKEEKG